jgi:hypothetical protein
VSRDIVWIDVIEREPGTLSRSRVIQSYPFPDLPRVPNPNHPLIGYGGLLDVKRAIDNIEDDTTRLCNQTRLWFITNRWHPKNFLTVSIKNWRYNT